MWRTFQKIAMIFTVGWMIALCIPDVFAKKETLQGGWYHWDPYQYLENRIDQQSLTGLDVELQRILFEKLGYKIQLKPVAWDAHQEGLKTGEFDYAMGAFFSKERAKFSYISKPYRFEENAFFRRQDDPRFPRIPRDVKAFLKFVKENNLKIGVVDGYRYANPLLNDFIDDPEHADLIVKSPTDNQNLRLLLSKDLDGFLADRIVGATITWREGVGNQVVETLLDAKAPIHILLSKASFSSEEVARINEEILRIKQGDTYNRIVDGYLYPVLLLETIDSPWLVWIQQLGIVVFAISGLILAYQYQTTLLGAFLLALLPSFGGGILRDVISGNYPTAFITSEVYMVTLLTVVGLGFLFLKTLQFCSRFRFFKRHVSEIEDSYTVLDNLLVITDALGVAVFTIGGIVVCLVIKAEPLWMWGPFFGFITGAGGGLLREVMLKPVKIVQAIHGNLYGEIPILWGLVLSIYLTYTAYDVDPFKIKMSVFLTIVLIFLTRIWVHFFNIPNIYFSKISVFHQGKTK